MLDETADVEVEEAVEADAVEAVDAADDDVEAVVLEDPLAVAIEQISLVMLVVATFRLMSARQSRQGFGLVISR